jgi:hypothetical protein
LFLVFKRFFGITTAGFSLLEKSLYMKYSVVYAAMGGMIGCMFFGI